MKKIHKILKKDSGDLVYMVSDGDNVIAWFADREHAKEFANIRNGGYCAVRRHELDRIRENIDRIFERDQS